MKTVVKHRELNLALGENLEVGMAGRGRLKSRGTYAYSWMIHAVVWQAPTQRYKTISTQLNTNLRK